LGSYLDDNIDVEREEFRIPKSGLSLTPSLSIEDIQRAAARITANVFETDVKSRLDKKTERTKEYVQNKAPYHKLYLKDLDVASMPLNVDEIGIEIALQRVKFEREVASRNKISSLLAQPIKEDEERLKSLISEITDIGMTDLAHYVCNRKYILDLLKDGLKRDPDGKSQLEQRIHDLIMPRGKDDQTVAFEGHNLWVLDERLVFAEYVASDRRMIPKDRTSDRPDILAFDRRQAFRSGDNVESNPLMIYEFKRPKRTEYAADEDPITQVGDYTGQIKLGKYEMPEGLEPIKVDDSTPVYAYIVADMCSKLDGFAQRASLTKSPDGEGYFGFHPGYRVYFEIMSYRRLHRSADMRHQVFFHKLHLS
jgi:hypothetical protein